jgi:hypothetical protein
MGTMADGVTRRAALRSIGSELAQEAADPFALDGWPFVLGQTGLRYRLAYTGQGTLLDPQLPRSVILLADNGVVAS